MSQVWDRRVAASAAAPWWPPAVAVLLSVVALIQVVPGPPVYMLMALTATLPVALCGSLPWLALGLSAGGVLTTVLPGLPVTVGALAALAVTTLTLALGLLRRSWTVAVQRDRARRAAADSMLEHVARGERARIARELHDVVAHHLSMISVQAEAARVTTPGLPPEGVQRLAAIGDTARVALTEMRRLLGVLREDAGGEPTRRPQPSLHQLNELIDEARRLRGGGTRLIVRGQVAPLDHGIELTAYRIVQEALTNARRHAPGAAVDVELDYGERELRVRIRDNGPGAVGSSPGHGLTGMHERATMVGGRLTAGPAPLSGFLVEATLPTGGSDT